MTHSLMPRRDFLRNASLAGVVSALPDFTAAQPPASAARVREEVVPPAPEEVPRYSVKFAVCGISHPHIYGMIEAVKRGGGALVKVWALEPDLLAAFKKRYPDVAIAETQDEIMHDPSIQLVLSSQIANERAPIGVRCMRAGKDFLSDKPGITTLEQLDEVRKTIAATGRIYAIMYSERLEVKAAVKAGELIQAGAIGNVIQTSQHRATPDSAASRQRCRQLRRWSMADPPGSGKTCSLAAFSATSGRTRSISFSTTPARQKRRLSRRRWPMYVTRTIRSFRISAT